MPSTLPSHTPLTPLPCAPPPQVIVIDGDRYDGLTPTSASSTGAQTLSIDTILRACTIDRSAAKGALLKAEAGVPVMAHPGPAADAARAADSASANQALGRPHSRASAKGSSDMDDDDDAAEQRPAGGRAAKGGAGGRGGAAAGAAWDDDGPHDRVVLLPQGGLVTLSGLRCCASSEAVLQGKGCRFRLAVRALDPATGAPLPNVSGLGSLRVELRGLRVAVCSRGTLFGCTNGRYYWIVCLFQNHHAAA